VGAQSLKDGLPVFHPLTQLGLIASNGEGRRHMKAGALRINDAPLTEERALKAADVVDGQIKLSIGKKRHGLVKVVS
jgi:tyrosyl-tRNA synthetase